MGCLFEHNHIAYEVAFLMLNERGKAVVIHCIQTMRGAERQACLLSFAVGVHFQTQKGNRNAAGGGEQLLFYMQSKLPVLACTEPNTDIGKVITEGGFGWWCGSDNSNRFVEQLTELVHADLSMLGIPALNI